MRKLLLGKRSCSSEARRLSLRAVLLCPSASRRSLPLLVSHVTERVFNVFQAGANMIVSGSAIMKSADPRSVINLLRNVCSEAAQKRCLDR